MFVFKRLLHDFVIALASIVSRFLPDRVPVTFVGADASRELCESIAHTHARKVLIVTDAVLVEIGLIDPVTESLRAAGMEWSIYSGVEPDPTFAHVQEGLAQLQLESCDAILASPSPSSRAS